MAIEVSQSIAPEVSLFSDSSTQNRSDQSFQLFLEEEQKRIGLMYSPFGQFDFSNLFGYPEQSKTESPSLSFISHDSDRKDRSSNNEISSSLNANNTSDTNPTTGQSASLLSKEMRSFINDLYLKNNWVIPNLEFYPAFFQAQIGDKLLGSFDLQALVDEITSRVSLVKDKGKVQLIVGLKPENIGEVLLTLTSKSGMISIEIQAYDKSKKLLDSNIEELKTALNKMHIKWDKITITELKEEENA